MTAVTVTDCGVLQLAVVNVRLAAENVHWSGLAGSAAMVTVTLAVGAEFSTIVKAPVPPPSVAELSVVLTVIPGAGGVQVAFQSVPLLVRVSVKFKVPAAVTVHVCVTGIPLAVISTGFAGTGPLAAAPPPASVVLAVFAVPVVGVKVMTTTAPIAAFVMSSVSDGSPFGIVWVPAVTGRVQLIVCGSPPTSAKADVAASCASSIVSARNPPVKNR